MRRSHTISKIMSWIVRKKNVMVAFSLLFWIAFGFILIIQVFLLVPETVDYRTLLPAKRRTRR